MTSTVTTCSAFAFGKSIPREWLKKHGFCPENFGSGFCSSLKKSTSYRNRVWRNFYLKALTCQELEDVLVLLTEIESPQTPLQITDPILKQLLVDDRPLSAVIDETENLTNRRHTLYKVNPAGFALACAAKAAEFQGDSKPGGIQYCPMPDIDFLATINHLEN